MAINLGEGDDMMSEINVTPLVDVMLVLLTVFIVTAPLLMNAVDVKLPQANANIAVDQLKNSRISITSQGDIYFDDAQLSESLLEARLKQSYANADFSVEIFADEGVEYGVVAKVMAAIQRAGVSRFSFVLQPEAKA